MTSERRLTWIRLPAAIVTAWLTVSATLAAVFVLLAGDSPNYVAAAGLAAIAAGCGYATRQIWPTGARLPALNRTYRDHYCTACGTVARARLWARGSLALELALWLTALATIPLTVGLSLLVSLSYTLGRHARRRELTCTHCQSDDIISLSSPRARRDLDKIDAAP